MIILPIKGQLQQWTVKYIISGAMDGQTLAPSADKFGVLDEEGVYNVTCGDLGIIDPDLFGGRGAFGDRFVSFINIETNVGMPPGFAMSVVDASLASPNLGIIETRRITTPALVGTRRYLSTECTYVPQGQALRVTGMAAPAPGTFHRVTIGVRAGATGDDEARLAQACCCQSEAAGGGVQPVPPGPEEFRTGIFNVVECGAVGDGVTDDTAAIQNCIDLAIAAGPGTAVFLPNGVYRAGNLVINDATDFRFYGNDATIQWLGATVAPNRIGLRMTGTCTRVQIEHLGFVGDGLAASRHAGVYSSSGSFLQSCSVSYCRIAETTLGVSFDMTAAGSYARDCVVEHNTIEHIVGIDSGFGYGIHFADGSGVAAGHSILFNNIYRAQRHGIYVALGSTVLVHGNKIFDHRDELDDGAVRFAMNLGRTAFIVATANQIIRSHSTSVGIAADAGGIAQHVIFANNEIVTPFVNPLFPMPCMEVGLDIDTNGQANDILIEGNKITTDGIIGVDALRLNWGRRIVVRSNSIEMENADVNTRAMNLRGIGEGAGTTTFSDDWVIQDNSFRVVDGGGVPTGAGIRLSPPFLDSGIRVTFGGAAGGGANRFIAAAQYSLAATLTNPNIYSWEGVENSWSLATGPATNPTRSTSVIVESVLDRNGLVLEYAVPTSLQTLTGGFEGKEITLWFANANTTLVHNGGGSLALQLIGGINWNAPTGAAIRFKLIRGQWREIDRDGSTASDIFIDATLYGVLPNGLDQSANLQNAMDAAVAGGSRMVQVQAGTILLGSTVRYANNVTLRGQGAQATAFVFSGTGYAFEQATPGTRIFNVRFESFQITYGVASDGGILLNDVSLARLDNVVVFGPGIGIGNGFGFHITGAVSGNSVYNAFYHCRALSGENGFFVDAIGSNDTHLIDCRATACSRGVYVVDSNHVVIDICAIESSTRGVVIDASISAVSDSLTISNTRFESNATANIQFGEAFAAANVRYPNIHNNHHVTGVPVVGSPSFPTFMGDTSGLIRSLQITTPFLDQPFRLERTVAAPTGEVMVHMVDSNAGSGAPVTVQITTERVSPQIRGVRATVTRWEILSDGSALFTGAVSCAGLLTSTLGATGNVSFVTPGQSIFLGDGVSAGNVTLDMRKADANAFTFATWRIGTAAAGLRWLWQFAANENLNLQRYDAAGSLVDTPFILDWTSGLATFTQVTIPIVVGNVNMSTGSLTMTLGNISLLAAGALVIFGDGASAGNVGAEVRKADANNITWYNWRIGTAAAGLRRIEQWDTSENWNTILANGSGTLDGFTTEQIDYTNRLRRERRALFFTLGTTLTNGAFGTTGMGAGATAVVVANSKDPRGEVTITIGTAPGANPTVTLTFVDGTLPTTPFGDALIVGGTGFVAGTVTRCTRVWSTTTLVWTLIGTPLVGETYVLSWAMMG